MRAITFFEAVNTEIVHAREKFPDQEKTLTLAEWLAVLTEEVGEFAKEINDAPWGDEFDDAVLARMHAELVQVAAVAGRICSAVEERSA